MSGNASDMAPVDTSRTLAIFPGQMSLGFLLTCAALGVLFLLPVPFMWTEGERWLAVMTLALSLFFLVVSVVIFRRQRKGTPDPTLTLTPEGLRLVAGTVGLVPWRDMRSLGGLSVKGNAALIVNVDEAAIARLDQSKTFKTTRKLDAAIGIHGLTFFQQQLELPIPVVADLLHQYSIAHGGPALVPDP